MLTRVKASTFDQSSDYDFTGELKKNGVDVVTFDSLPTTVVITADMPITVAGSYFINGSHTVTLADAALFADGESVVITPATGFNPVILSVADGIKDHDGTLHDTVNFDTHVTLTFIANNSKWEI